MCASRFCTGQVLLDGGTGIARGQPGQVWEHALWSLALEPVQCSLKPGGGQSPSCCPHGLPDLIDVFGSMGKIQDAHGIRTVVVDQPSPPLRSILHGAGLCRPFHPSPMRFDQGRFREALGIRRREKVEVCCVQTSPSASVLTSTHSPPTRCTIAPSALSRCLSTPLGAWGTSCLRRLARRRLTHLDPDQFGKQFPCLLKWHPARQSRQGFLPTRRL